jgi:hypothetical protein
LGALNIYGFRGTPCEADPRQEIGLDGTLPGSNVSSGQAWHSISKALPRAATLTGRLSAEWRRRCDTRNVVYHDGDRTVVGSFGQPGSVLTAAFAS